MSNRDPATAASLPPQLESESNLNNDDWALFIKILSWNVALDNAD